MVSDCDDGGGGDGELLRILGALQLQVRKQRTEFERRLQQQRAELREQLKQQREAATAEAEALRRRVSELETRSATRSGRAPGL